MCKRNESTDTVSSVLKMKNQSELLKEFSRQLIKNWHRFGHLKLNSVILLGTKSIADRKILPEINF